MEKAKGLRQGQKAMGTVRAPLSQSFMVGRTSIVCKMYICKYPPLLLKLLKIFMYIESHTKTVSKSSFRELRFPLFVYMFVYTSKNFIHVFAGQPIAVWPVLVGWGVRSSYKSVKSH
jgi:hypothetical protein